MLHIPDSQYCFAVGERELVIRLRMAREDAGASVTLLYAGKYKFQQERYPVAMEIRYTDRLYNYYETKLTLTDVRLAYVFLIKKQGEIYYFCEDGLTREYDFAEGFYNFFQMPYINRNDVLPTVTWMKSAVFYQIFVDRFFRGDKTKDTAYINMEWGGCPTPKSFASLVQFEPVPATTGTRCLVKSTAALITFACSSVVSVELSPVVPAIMIQSVPWSICQLISSSNLS